MQGAAYQPPVLAADSPGSAASSTSLSSVRSGVKRYHCTFVLAFIVDASSSKRSRAFLPFNFPFRNFRIALFVCCRCLSSTIANFRCVVVQIASSGSGSSLQSPSPTAEPAVVTIHSQVRALTCPFSSLQVTRNVAACQMTFLNSILCRALFAGLLLMSSLRSCL